MGVDFERRFQTGRKISIFFRGILDRNLLEPMSFSNKPFDR
jgi:hypothetical protein